MRVRIAAMQSWGGYVLGSLLLHGVCLWIGWSGSISPPQQPLSHPVMGVHLMGAYDTGTPKVVHGSAPMKTGHTTPQTAEAHPPTDAPQKGPSRPISTHSSSLSPTSMARPSGAVPDVSASGVMGAKENPMAQDTGDGQSSNGTEPGEGPIVRIAGPVQTGNPAPVYPSQARDWGHQGVVRLKVRVLKTGRVSDVSVMASSGYHALDRAALDAVKRWQFIPARTPTDTIDSWVTIPIRFKLHSSNTP